MKLVVAVAVAVVVAVSCQASVGARVDQPPAVPEAIEPPTTTTTSLRRPAVIVSGPVRYLGDGGVYRMAIDWSHDIVYDDADLTVRMVGELSLTPTGLWSADAVDLDYDVAGELVLDLDSVVCVSAWTGRSCGVVSVTDASLAGVAELRGRELRVWVTWRRYGLARDPGRPSFVVGDWPTETGRERILTRSELFDPAAGLEASGLIGGSFIIDIADPHAVRLSGASASGRGSGLIELLAAA